MPLHRVNFSARTEYEKLQNLKILQDVFAKCDIKRAVDIKKLVNGKFQDNMEFCQWLKHFHSIKTSRMSISASLCPMHFSVLPCSLSNSFAHHALDFSVSIFCIRSHSCAADMDYPAEERRNEAIASYSSGHKHAAKSFQPASGGNAGPAASAAAAAPAAAAPAKMQAPSSRAPAPGAVKQGGSASCTFCIRQPQKRKCILLSRLTKFFPSESILAPPFARTAGDADAKIAEQTQKIAKLRLAVEGLEKERDFYFAKLRDIEVLCQAEETVESAALKAQVSFLRAVPNRLAHVCRLACLSHTLCSRFHAQILEILYKTDDEEFEAPQQSGESA